MGHEVFISHSSLDKPVADAVCAGLEKNAIRCWIAPRDVQPGRSFAGEITRAIQHSKVMVLIFSANSNTSEQILREVQLAANSHLHIVQFRIENVLPNEDLEYYLSAPHWLDALTPPLESNIRRLGISVKALLEMAAEDPAKRAMTPVAPSVDSRAERSQQGRVAATKDPAAQSQPAIPPVASISAIAASKEPAVWRRKRLIIVTAGGATVMLLLTITVLLTRSHRSIDSSAEKDYAEAMKLAAGLGGTRINAPKAAECFQRAAAKNLPEAEARLAYWTSNGIGGLPKDNVKAEQWAKKAIEHGLTTKATNNAEAQTELAVLYEYGLGVSKDETKAAELAQKAAGQGYTRAQNALGLLYQNGQGVTKDLGKGCGAFPKSG
jgi:TPR repeat protein